MSDLEISKTASQKVEEELSEDDSINEVVKIVKTQLSMRQKKQLGLKKPHEEYTKPRTEKQKANDERLRLANKERSERLKQEKQEYEEAKLREIQLKLNQKEKRKNKVKDFDEEEYKKFLEFKRLSKAAPPEDDDDKPKPKPKQKKIETESDDDGYIQSKSKKAEKILQQVNHLDNQINKLSTPSANPWLDAFNRKR